MSHVSHFRVPLKMISAVVAGIFLFQEIVWAGDIVSLIQPASEPAPNSSSVEVIQSGQTQAETLIAAKNAIEDFSLQVSPGEATLSTSHGIEYDREVARTTGWTFYYRSDVLVEKSHEDGRAYVYSYDEAGRISAFDYYKAGDVFYYTQEYDRDANGNVTAARRVFSNGNTYHYTPNWKVTRIDYADGRALTYTYDAEWKVTGRVMYYAPGGVQYSEIYSYDASGALEGITRAFTGGNTYHYAANWKTLRIDYADGRALTYTYDAEWKVTGRVMYYAPGGVYYSETYFYYVSGELEGITRLFDNGNTYHYSPNWKVMRIDYADGRVLTYAYDGSWGLSERIMYRADGTRQYRYTYVSGVLSAKELYYISGNLSSVTYTVSDEKGFAYYRYVDEDLNGTGIGRLKIARLAERNDAGELAFEYSYSGSTMYVNSYSEASGGDLIAEYRYNQEGVLARKIDHVSGKTFMYYAVSGRLFSMETSVPDESGNTLYLYMDEDFYAASEHPAGYYGRVSAFMRTEPDSDSAVTFNVAYDNESSDMARTVSGTSGETILVSRYLYADTGSLVSKTTFYESGLTESVTFSAPDAENFVYYHYADTEFAATGQGLADIKILSVPDPDGSIAYSYEYYETGIVQRRTGYAEADYSLSREPVISAVTAIYEYDETGRPVVHFDEIIGSYGIRRELDGSLLTYMLDGSGGSYLHTVSSAEGGFLDVYERDDAMALVSVRRTYDDGVIELYEPMDGEGNDLRLIEKKIPERPFIKGVNLPWMNYGYDLGELPGSDLHYGFSSRAADLYSKFDMWKGSYVRVFLFTDLRSSIEFDAEGFAVGFTDRVFEDMRSLLEAAKTFGVKLVPVLFDYGIADGVTHEGEYEVGENPGVILDDAKKAALMDVLSGFFEEFAANDAVYAWDIINEPEWSVDSGTVNLEAMRAFVSGMSGLIRSKAPEALVTLGSRNRTDMALNWQGLGLDIYQYHYYDRFEDEGYPLDYPAGDLALDGSVIAGELEPTFPSDKLDTLFDNSYYGGFLWQDDRYSISDWEKEELSSWFRGETITYEYHPSGVKSLEVSSDGTEKEFEDAELNRLLREIYVSTGAYKEYLYYEGTDNVSVIGFYMPDGSVYMTREYADTGDLTETSMFYAEGGLMSVERPDGSWENYAETGELAEWGESLDGAEITYDPAGRIIKVKSGGREETREYVEPEGMDVLYTYALTGGIVTGVFEGYYDGIELLSSSYPDNAGEVTVTYDGGIKAGYSGGMIKSLSVEDGFVNFYSDTSTVCQNGADGTLYVFEAGYLSRVVTPLGNVYDFTVIEDAGTVTVTPESAVIGDALFGLSGGKFSSISYGGEEIEITRLDILDHLEIGRLDIVSGASSVTLNADSSVYQAVLSALREMKSDIPNLTFTYGPEGGIQSITTSEYSRLEFSENLISKAVSAEGVEVNYEFAEVSQGVTHLKVTDPSGAVRTYGQGGELISIELPETDGGLSTLGFSGGELSSLESSGTVLSDIVLDAEGEIESARLMSPEGNVYFFVTGDLEGFIEDDNIEYELDQESGRIFSFTLLDTGEVFYAEYGTGDQGEEIITFHSGTTDAMYRFTDRVISLIRDAKGVEVEYEYFTYGDVFKRIRVYFNGRAAHVYDFYGYEGGITKVVDDANYARYYGDGNRLERIETPYGETYDYLYYEDETPEGPVLRKASNYSRKVFQDGTEVRYFKGAIVSIYLPDGTIVDDILFDEFTGELLKFTYHLAEGDFYKVRLHKAYTMFELSDGSMLVFSDGQLVAFAGPEGYVGLYDELEGLDEIFFDLSEEGYGYYGSGLAGIDVAASHWRPQTSSSTGMLGITSVLRDYSSAEWKVDVDIESGSAVKQGGEMFLDLRYDIPGLEFQAPIDMTGPDDRVSFYFRPDGDFTVPAGRKCFVQIFVKDSEWDSQYGTPVEINPLDPDTWREVFLKPSLSTPQGGYTDQGFDPSKIVMMGIRIIPEYGAPEGLLFSGNIFVRENLIIPDLFANVNSEATPQDSAYYDQGLTRRSGQPEYTAAENTLNYFYSAMASGAYYENQRVWLKSLGWKVKTEAGHVRAATSIKKNPLSQEELLITMDMNSSVFGKKEGEVFFNITNIVPGLSYSDPVNLTGRKLSMLVKAPEGFIGPEESPNGIRLFVEDEYGNKQYGTWTNIKEGGKWYKIDIMPTTGELPSGFTQAGFNPSKIVRIGLNIAAGEGNEIDFKGDISAKFMPRPDFSTVAEPEGMPVWMDLRGLKEYLLDQAGNVLNVPPVNIINSEYFSYVLNRGSGNAPTANFEVIESSLTNWEYYGKYPEWQGSESNKGITSIAWASSGENLVAGIGLSSARVSGEIELNLAYVPGRNWQSVLDMTTRKIKFTITPGAGLVFDPAAKVTASIFVKNSEGSWPGEYSVPVEIDLTGEGTELYLVPTVEMFHEGFFQAGFDPTAVGLIGLKVQCDNGKTVTGTFDISYTLESITEAGSELLDTGGLPSMPVWVDQRAFSDYIRAEGIELFCSSGIFDMADTLSRLVPSYNLPSDFAAYTVFDGDDNVVSITRANGSTAFIDADGRMDLITHRDGSVFVDYEYDEEGDLVSATLVSSRKRIEDAIEDAAFRMEKEKVDRMLYLDTVDEVVREEFEEDVARARAEFARVRRQLESQLYVEVKRGFWFWTWTERVEVPGVRAEIEKLNQREREFNRDIAEKMAERDGAFREVRDTAEAEFARVTEEYAWQRRKLLLATARQEAVPVIHYYYWEVLGREPGEEELENLFRRVDETNLFAGIFEEDITDKESFILRIGALSDTPFYGLLPEDLKSFVSGFTAGSVIPDETVNALITALDKMISGEELYAAMIGRYGSEQALREELSEATLGYISELAVVSAENVLVREEYALKTAELSLIKANIESFRALKIELLRLLENPETISSYTGYWRDNLFNIYDTSSLILKKDRLYLRSFDELAGVYTETELTGFLESYTAEFSVLGEIRSIVMPGDLLSMEMAYAEFIDVVARYSSHMEELLARGDIAREWMNRGIIQDHFAGCIVSKDKNTIEFSAENLKNELIASEEHSALLAFKESVILAVSEFLDAYLSDGAAREGLLAGIGLAPEDVIDLTSSYASNIAEWLENQDIHFGRSAFGSLKEYIDEATGGEVDLAELSAKTILIDVLAGNIGPFAGPDLEISMYAMSRAASFYGAQSRTRRFAWEDLASAAMPVVTLINLHHYVTVVSASDAEVTYFETNLGQNGGMVTVGKEEFMDTWQGNVIVDEASTSGTLIQESESRKIKGAFLFAIIGMIAGFLMSSITAIVAVAAQVIAAVIAGVSVILEGIMLAMSHVIFGISQLFTFVGQSFLGFGGISGIGSAFEGFISGLGVSSLVNPGAQTFIQIGVGYGISAGLDMMGVDPTISGMVSSIVTGGVHGFFEGAGIGAVFQSALQVAAIRGVSLLGEYLNLDPVITNLLSMSTFALTGAVFDPGSFSEVLNNVTYNIVGELAYYGVTYAGDALGIDPRVSYLAGIGIRSSLRAGFSDGQDPGKYLLNGLLRGVTNIGFQWAYEEMEIDPLLGSLGAAAMTGMIEGLLEGQNAINGIYDSLFKAGTGLVTLGGYGGDPWQQAAYIAQVLDFTDIIRDRGIVEALETYATGFLHQTAIDNIWKMGGIYDLVTNNAEVVTNEEGEVVKRVYINEGKTDFIDLTLDLDDMFGFKQGNILVDCPIVMGPDGRPTTPNGKIKILLEGESRIVYYIKDWATIKVEYVDIDGNLVGYILPMEDGTPIEVNEDMSVKTGKFYNVEKNFIIDKIDNEIVRAVFTPRSDLTEEQIQKLVDEGVNPWALDGVKMEYDKDRGTINVKVEPGEVDPGDFEGRTSYLRLISANGISNELGEYTPPTYEQQLKYRLSLDGINENAIYLLPMFEGNNVARDLAMWLLDNAGVNILTGEIIAKLDGEIYGDIEPGQQYTPKVAVNYSGSVNSFYKAINARHDFVIKDVINLGGPTTDGIIGEIDITNPNTERIFNIWGSKDILVPFTSNKKFSTNVEGYNIRILGATHFDYFYAPERGELNSRTSYFVEEFIKRVYTNGDINAFLSGPGITYDDNLKVYNVDPFAIEYDPQLEWRNGE